MMGGSVVLNLCLECGPELSSSILVQHRSDLTALKAVVIHTKGGGGGVCCGHFLPEEPGCAGFTMEGYRYQAEAVWRQATEAF